MVNYQKKIGLQTDKTANRFIGKLAFLLVLSLIIGSFFSACRKGEDNKVSGYLDVDVLPGITLALNDKQEVVGALFPCDADRTVFDGISFDGLSCGDAFVKLINSLVQHGYLLDDQPDMLLSFRSDEKDFWNDRQYQLLAALDQALSETGVTVTVWHQDLSRQTVPADDAEADALTPGKMVLIQKLCAKDSTLKPSWLARLSVSEIGDIVLSSGWSIYDFVSLDADGSRFDKQDENNGLISLAEAKASAVSSAGFSDKQPVFIKTEQINREDASVYEIVLLSEGNIYTVTIDAKNGQVLSVKSADGEDAPVSDKSNKQMISLAEAELIAVNRAGISPADVIFTVHSCKLYDHAVVYELCYENGKKTFECLVRADDGSIVSFVEGPVDISDQPMDNPPAKGDEQVSFTLTADKTRLVPGDTLTVTVRGSTDIPAACCGFEMVYDPAVFSFYDAEWLIKGGTLSGYDEQKNFASIAFHDSLLLNGDLFALTLTVNEDASAGDATVKAVPSVVEGTDSLTVNQPIITLKVSENGQETMNISLDAAKAICLADAGIDQKNAVFDQPKISGDAGKKYYRIAFTADGRAYRYYVALKDGIILQKSSEAVSDGGHSSIPDDSSYDMVSYLTVNSADADQGTLLSFTLKGKVKTQTDTAGLIIAFDEQVFTPAAGQWLLPGLLLSDFDEKTARAVTCYQPLDSFEGDIFTFAMRVNQNAAPGNYVIEVVPVFKLGSTQITCQKQSVSISVSGKTAGSAEDSARQNDASDLLVTPDAAKMLAFACAKVSPDDADSVEINLRGTAGSQSYEVAFAAEGKKHTCVIDAQTGAIIDYHVG